MRRVPSLPWAGLAGLILAAALFASTLNPSLGSFSGDEARFVLLSRALAQGLGYVELQTPGHPPHTEYLPGLPLLLLPVTLWQDDNFLAMKIPILACALLALALIYFLFKTESQRLAWALALLTATMPLFLDNLVAILADVPYLAASLLTLLWMQRALNRGDFRPKTWIIAGLLAALSFFFRPLGLALAAGVITGILLNPTGQLKIPRLKTLAVFILAFGLPVGAWFLRNYLATGYLDREHFSKLLVSKQSDPFSGELDAEGIVWRIKRRIEFYARNGATELVPLSKITQANYAASVPFRSHPTTGSKAVDVPPWRRKLVIALFCLGFLESLIRRRGFVAWYLLFYIAILALWRFHNVRFLIAIVPLLYYFCYRGIKYLLALLPLRAFQFVVCSLLGIILLANGFESYRLISSYHGSEKSNLDKILASDAQALAMVPSFRCEDYLEIADQPGEWEVKSEGKCLGYLRSLAIAEWAHQNLSPEAIVISRKPTLFALFSRTYSIQFPPEKDLQAMLQALTQRGADYILADEASPMVQTYMTWMQEKSPKHFEVLFSIGQSRLLRFIP